MKFLSPEKKPLGEFCFWPSCAGIPLPFCVRGVSRYLHRVQSTGTAATLWSRGVYVWEQEAVSLCFLLGRVQDGYEEAKLM